MIATLETNLPRTITLESNIQTTAWPVEAEPTQIHQMLLNLGVNARDAMPQGGVLSINLHNRTLDSAEAETIHGASAGDWVVVEVVDTGTGIPPDVLPKIWDAFFTTKPDGAGTGLGLATVRGIVLGHHGFVQVETEVGKGTTFRIFLPASRIAESSGDTNAPMPVSAAHQEYIMVVDDEAMVRETIAAALSVQGYRVIDCTDGVDALVKFNDHAREMVLVITDLDMPGLNGAILAGTLRKLQPDLPIIAISGFANAPSLDTPLQELKALANAYLEKPFTAPILLRTVADILSRPRK